MSRRLVWVLKILCLVLGVVTIILGANEATVDALDRIGSNYWLAYVAVISGAVIIAIIAISSRRKSPK